MLCVSVVCNHLNLSWFGIKIGENFCDTYCNWQTKEEVTDSIDSTCPSNAISTQWQVFIHDQSKE